MSFLFIPNQHFRTAIFVASWLASCSSWCGLPDTEIINDLRCTDYCLEPLDEHGKHIHLCKAGPARLRPHRGLANVLAAELRRVGSHTDVERACPQLFQENDNGCIHEAILDVVYHAPGEGFQRMIDVTIRCPHAQRYEHVNCIAGVATYAGEKDKKSRYDSSVLAISFEIYGRLGSLSISNLRMIALDLALLANYKRSPAWYYDRLRFSLERALVHEISDMVILALGSTAGLWNWMGRRCSGF